MNLSVRSSKKQKVNHTDCNLIRKSKNDLILKYQYLVYDIVEKFFNEKMSLEDKQDLIHEGILWLAEAIHTFNPRKEKTLSEYMSSCIQKGVMQMTSDPYNQFVQNSLSEISEKEEVKEMPYVLHTFSEEMKDIVSTISTSPNSDKSERNCQMMYLRYDFDKDCSVKDSLEGVGLHFGVTRQCVDIIQKKFFRKLRKLPKIQDFAQHFFQVKCNSIYSQQVLPCPLNPCKEEVY